MIFENQLSKGNNSKKIINNSKINNSKIKINNMKKHNNFTQAQGGVFMHNQISIVKTGSMREIFLDEALEKGKRKMKEVVFMILDCPSPSGGPWNNRNNRNNLFLFLFLLSFVVFRIFFYPKINMKKRGYFLIYIVTIFFCVFLFFIFYARRPGLVTYAKRPVVVAIFFFCLFVFYFL